MQFTTKVDIEKSSWGITHDNAVVTIGSCFSAEIGRRLQERLFDTDINPAGTLFNPASIAMTLRRILTGEEYRHDELVETPDGMWHLMSHHSEFSSRDRDTVIENANNRQRQAAEMLFDPKAVLMVTFGSARAFKDIPTGMIAGNCHKLPSSRFEVVDLNLDLICREWEEIIAQLHEANPSLHIILTVSPVRHKAYGLVADRISKSTLILACDRLRKQFPAIVNYFPAYEIFTDELRDYRFYASDMVHPSETGADYVFERFTDTYIPESEAEVSRRGLSLSRRLSHRLINRNDPDSIKFEEETGRQAETLSSISPRIARTIEKLNKKL